MLFVSYARLDLPIAQAFVQRLESRGIACWLDEANIPLGKAFVARLGEALRVATDFVVIDTANSRESYWVQREARAAIRLKSTGIYRNIFRVTAKSSDAGPFDAQFANLGVWSEAIDRLLNAVHPPSSASPRLSLPPSILFDGLTPNDPDGWTGRQQELRLLDEWWQSRKRLLWINGMGGIGKTSVLETWLAALKDIGYEDTEIIRIRYVRAREIQSIDDATLNQWLQVSFFGTKLLVIDGLDESPIHDSLQAFVTGQQSHGARMLVTSRVQPPNESSVTTLELGSMTKGECVNLMVRRGLSVSDATVISAEIDNHPLSAMLIANLVVRGGHNVSELLYRLRSDLSGQTHSATVDVLLSHVHAHLSEGARDLLYKVVASASGTDDGTSTILPSSLTSAADRHAMAELAEAGLIEVAADNPSVVSVHPLVHQWVTTIVAYHAFKRRLTTGSS